MQIGEIFTIAAYFVGAIAFWMAARRRQMATEGVIYLALAALIGGVAGAKIGEWTIGQGAISTAILDPRGGGRTIIGGVIGGWIAVEIAKKRLGIVRSTGDLFAFALPWGEAVGRIGCWFNGCCEGALYGGPCAVWQHDAWRYPAQFLSAAAAIAIGLTLWHKRERFRYEGEAWHLYLALWGACRFAIEWLRDHGDNANSFSTAQWFALGIAAIGFASLRRERSAGRRAPA